MDIKKGHCWRCEKKLPKNPVKCDKCPLAEYCNGRCRVQDTFRHGCYECRVFGPKQCNHCEKLGNVKECAACNNAWYCNAACQQKHWATHKEQCKQVSTYIKETGPLMGAFHTSLGDDLHKTADPPSYIGNTIAIDFLQLEGNEWSESRKLEGEVTRDYHVLSAGCGDLRNTVLTVASLPETYQGKLHVSLDDFDPFVMARNVMFLVMMVQYADRDGIASSLATIWYSVHISRSDYNLIKATLQELVKMSHEGLYGLTRGTVRVQEADISYMREVWEGWLVLKCQRKAGNPINLHQQRKKIFEDDSAAQVGLSKYLNKMSQTDARFMKKWFDHGLFLPKNVDQGTLPFDNPTLTGRPSLLYESRKMRQNRGMSSPKDYNFVYCINTDATPFKVWDCLRVEEFTLQRGLSVMERYHAYVTHLLRQAINFIGLERLKVGIFLANCLDFPNHHLTLKMPNYDRIYTSNLSDLYSHGILLKILKPLLNSDNKYSVIVMQTMNWIQNTPGADVQNVSWLDVFKYLSLCQQDTGMCPDLATDVNNHREYFNNAHWFLAYLRADIMGGGIGVPVMDYIPKLGEVMHYNGMQMRDFRKGLNKLVPFQYRVNARKITLLNGMDRNVEWSLPAKQGNAQ